MKPVEQLVIDDGKGDCLRACVASILEYDAGEVPNFAELDFFNGLDEWLSAYGRRFLRISLTGGYDSAAIWFGYPTHADDFMIVWGESPRLKNDGGRKTHAVVGRAKGYGIEIVHDPHPDKTGLKSIEGFGWLVRA
jgi:hypothetical protein